MSPEDMTGERPGEVIARFIDQRARTSSRTDHAPIVVGLCGAQGIGKSTVSHHIEHDLNARGYRSLVIGLDDLYLPRSARMELGRTVHPLLATRGVPGTHDIDLGLAVLRAAAETVPLALPRFDKAIDDRLPRSQWAVVESRSDIILLEGWCVGAVPQTAQELAHVANELERIEDPHGIWRSYVNTQLAESYQLLFAELDLLILLAAPTFEIVATWRTQQEEQLLRTLGHNRDASRTMNRAEIDRFVLHYERLTRHILHEMPERADLVLRLDTDRRIVGVDQRQ